MNLLKEIEERRSIRRFVPGVEIPNEDIMSILEAARKAPSGSNTQPWRFVVVQDPKKIEKLSSASLRQDYFKNCSCIIVCMANIKAKEQTEEKLNELAGVGAFSYEEVKYFVSVLRSGGKSPSDKGTNDQLMEKLNKLLIEGILSEAEVKLLIGALKVNLKAIADESKAIRDTAIAIYSMMLQATALGLGSCWIMINDKELVRKQIKLDDNSITLVAMLALGKAAETPSARPRFPLEKIAYFEEWNLPFDSK